MQRSEVLRQAIEDARKMSASNMSHWGGGWQAPGGRSKPHSPDGTRYAIASLLGFKVGFAYTGDPTFVWRAYRVCVDLDLPIEGWIRRAKDWFDEAVSALALRGSGPITPDLLYEAMGFPAGEKRILPPKQARAAGYDSDAWVATIVCIEIESEKRARGTAKESGVIAVIAERIDWSVTEVWRAYKAWKHAAKWDFPTIDDLVEQRLREMRE